MTGADQWPKMFRCPRRGVVKGRASEVRRTICADCHDVLTPAERVEWRESPRAT